MKINQRNPDSNRPMLIRYSHPFQEIETMRRQFDRLFSELNPSESTAWSPAIELKDEGDAFTLRAQLPGLAAKDIDIQVSRGVVSIAGEHQYQSEQADNGILRSEFRYGKFHRVVRLPAAVQNDQVQAEYKDGILHLTLPKTPEAKNLVVKINLGETGPAIAEDEPAPQTNA